MIHNPNPTNVMDIYISEYKDLTFCRKFSDQQSNIFSFPFLTNNPYTQNNMSSEYATVNVSETNGEPKVVPSNALSTTAWNSRRFISERKVSNSKSGLLCAWLFCLIMLSPAVASLVIALQYDKNTSPCNATSFTTDKGFFCSTGNGLKCFLMTAGILQISQFCFGTLLLLIDVFFEINGVKAGNRGGGCLGIFYMVWAIIGVVMYENQMSEECQQEAIGKMVLLWSVIQLSLCLFDWIDVFMYRLLP